MRVVQIVVLFLIFVELRGIHESLERSRELQAEIAPIACKWSGHAGQWMAAVCQGGQ